MTECPWNLVRIGVYNRGRMFWEASRAGNGICFFSLLPIPVIRYRKKVVSIPILCVLCKGKLFFYSIKEIEIQFGKTHQKFSPLPDILLFNVMIWYTLYYTMCCVDSRDLELDDWRRVFIIIHIYICVPELIVYVFCTDTCIRRLQIVKIRNWFSWYTPAPWRSDCWLFYD